MRTNSRNSRCSSSRSQFSQVSLVVLAVGVVVAVLRVAEFVAAHSIGTPCEKKQRGDEIAPLRRAQLDDGGIVGRPFDAAVPAVVVVGAVAVVFAVGFVVLVVVADEIVQREAVVAGDEVDAGVRPAAAPLVQVAAARKAAWRTRETVPPSPFQNCADAVAVLAVPLGPERPGKLPT